MKFLIQHNLMANEQLQKIEAAIRNVPHEFVGLIPFSHEITSETPLNGTAYIPYGSTLLTSLAHSMMFQGLHFNLNTFNYGAALKNRDDMLNLNVVTLAQAIDWLNITRKINPDSQWFVRPSYDLKQFSGQVIGARECYDWFKDMLECATSGSYKLEPDTEIVLCEPQKISAEWRWFIVGRKIVSGSMYRAHGQMRQIRELNANVIKEAQMLANKWLPDDCVVMDTALVDGQVKVIEFNCINSSGFYDNDVEAIFTALWKYHNK